MDRKAIGKLAALGAALVLLALAAGNSGSFSWAQGNCTTTVFPGGSIQRAIDNASSGAVVCLRAGTYQEGVSINKSLTLRGEGRGSVIIVGSLSVTNAVNVTIEGLTLQGGRGLVVVNSAKVVVRYVEVVESEAAGVLVSNSSIELVSNDITKNGGDGVAVFGSTVDLRANFIVENKGCG